ncbi:hypothetical protein AX17_003616 [Amanita inopinata Kibby_2008]|nr:hypothetical protein AX17_003616 [Amanita inopinata Kibby_2008]
MANLQVSPISQMLHTLGLTREDLSKRSDEMRQFLTAQKSPTLRVADRDIVRQASSDVKPPSRNADSKSTTARSVSCAASVSIRESSPPPTPIKTEPSENIASLRHYDSMEVVIERQRRQNKKEKRARREKEREFTTRSNLPHPASPSPSTASHASLNLDFFMHSRDDKRVSNSGASDSQCSNVDQNADAPVTPEKNRYYREHTHLSSTVQTRKEGDVHPKAETPTPNRLRHDTMSQTQPASTHRPNSRHSRILDGSAEASTSQIPVTPQKKRGLVSWCTVDTPDFSSSSPLLPSSPFSSPSRPIVNLVSSPGPMGPLPKEDEYDRLPYKLPPGPYSSNKPDLSYAALVGQAILSSPEHRLTLQEIYDWITIVYPHYKRGETTWMNSIRHVLSTTVCFRKVPRDRSVGRTLWAIWDEDLECFKGGGFRKHLCKDIMRAAQSSSKSKGKARKRGEIDDDVITTMRKSKKSKKATPTDPQSQASTSAQASYGAPPPLSHPLFPPTRPTPHHQPYYESCIMQPQPRSLPAEIIFPPLPPTAYTRIHAGSSTQSTAQNSSKSLTTSPHHDLPSDQQVPSSDASSMLSVPELTPNRSSSSPPPSLPLTSEVDLDDYINMDQAAHKNKVTHSGELRHISSSDGTSEGDTSVDGEPDDCEEVTYRGTTLGPVQYWGETPKGTKLRGDLRPGINLSANGDIELSTHRGGKEGTIFPPLPVSPTLERAARTLNSSSKAVASEERPGTPPFLAVPTTPPPRCTTSSLVSSERTPLSHKGLHMSPSASLAHYKSHLDPPPIYPYAPDVMPDVDEARTKTELDDASDPMRTPRRRTSVLPPPVTPKRLFSHPVESPFRTPLGGLGTSPFRTPGSRSIFDPHDPGTLLDEELSRSAVGQDDSPVGLFGKGRGSLLYDSPGALGSPGKWSKWW